MCRGTRLQASSREKSGARRKVPSVAQLPHDLFPKNCTVAVLPRIAACSTGRDPAVTDLLLAPCDYCWRVWPAQLWVPGDEMMLSRYSHVRMEAKRRALDEIAARQHGAEAKRREAEQGGRSKRLAHRTISKPQRHLRVAHPSQVFWKTRLDLAGSHRDFRVEFGSASGL